jgi:hypothetical protein
MDAAIVYVGDAPSATPSVLKAWAESRGLRLIEPAEGGRHVIPVDPAVAKSVEDSLHQAREMLAQHDADGAERALAHADGLLRAHPELPQAAWLLAEVERGWATRFSQLEPLDLVRAARHWIAADALDGGRAAGVGERSAAPDLKVPFALTVDGEPDVALDLDGEPIASGSREARPGLHQLVARAGGAVVFAQWVGIARDVTVHVAVPTPAPCSRADLSGPSVRCSSWVSARETNPGAGTYYVRSCSASACGAELLVARLTRTPIPTPHNPHGLPTWAAWTLAGVGAAALGVAIGLVTWALLPQAQQTIFKTTAPTN